MRSFPLFALLLTGMAALLFVLPAGDSCLVYERERVAQFWRFVTCHWVHWGFEHFVWSVGTFLLLAILCERESRRSFLVCVATATLAIPLALWGLAPNLNTYGGLSGVDSALFVQIAVRLVVEKRREGDTLFALGGVAVLLAFLGKIGFEFFAREPVFVSEDSGVTPVPLAHLVGGLVGAVINRDSHRLFLSDRFFCFFGCAGNKR
jgi:rhomboid family GlyGly-CTERM serine protease